MQAVQTYTLPPDKYANAVAYARARHTLHFADFAVSLLVLVVILRLKIAPRLRSKLHPALLIAAVIGLTSLCSLPLDALGHQLSLRFGISIEPWPAWLWDWTKAFAVGLAGSVILIWPFYILLRRSPRRWWFYAWLAAIPVTILTAYADPLIFEPMFNAFDPLAVKNPELVEPIEKMLQRAGVEIPRDHLFVMRASEKTNSLNAYVSGFGPSRRVVLYDTIIQKENGPPLLTTFGHELGHYVLHHILKGLAFGIAGLLAGLFLAYHAVRALLRRYGASLDIRDPADPASLPVFLAIVLVLGFLTEPIVNAYSRRQEHQADVYSIEITHGLIPNPQQAAARAFQIEGETDLDDPDPGAFVRFWLYSHPSTAERLRFSLEYDPWAKGETPQFVR